MPVEVLLYHLQKIPENVRFYLAWTSLALLGIIVAFQFRATLLFVGLFVVNQDRLRPPGWNSTTIDGLDRFLVLVLGASWLFMVAFLEKYLRGSRRSPITMRQRFVWLVITLVALYIGCYLFLAVLSLLA